MSTRAMFPSTDLALPPTPKSDEVTPPGRWYPCQAPEQPVDRTTVFHDCCTGCYLAAEMSERNGLTHRHGSDGRRMVDIMRERLQEWGEAPP